MSITYNEPQTKLPITRIYKYAPCESDSQAILSIVRALNFIYNEDVRFRINDDERKKDF